jgi:hypothetical protein
VPYSSRVSATDRSRWTAAGLSLCLAAALLFGAARTGAVFAQPVPQQSIIGVGNAVVTGFSGVVPPPTPLPPGVQPADKLHIDLAGPSARVVDLQNMGGPPAAQLVPAPKPFTATAGQIGQVYAVALDNASPPNVYVAATSLYGLPIVVPDKDGDGRPDRVKQGAPGASFMPGLWGPAAQGGGPGSIWKIDGVTGAITLFANVMLDGVPNSGPALGGLAFDPATSQLFVADRDTGMIHRFTMDGVDRGRYDHGVTGRPAAGLPPVPFNPANRLDVTNPAFNSENPATWQFTAPERLIFGLGVRGGRLFYAVASGLQIWSVSILPDGAFGGDARIEVQVPPALAPTEIAKIIFDDQGRMILGERGVPVGLYDFSVLAQESVSRVLRYAHVAPAPGAPPMWQPVPDEYAIGFPAQYRNANGGVAIGYRYLADGRIDRYSCGGYLWSTGEQLRNATDPAVTAQLSQSGPLNVNGLQGNSIELVRPQNVPPFQTYFIDYDDKFADPNALGHMGDVAVWRICGQGFLPGIGWWTAPPWMPPWWWLPPGGWCPPEWIVPGGFCGPPPQFCPPDQQKPGFQCCPKGTQQDAAGVCRPICPNGATDDASLFACSLGVDPATVGGAPGDVRCIGGALPNPAWGLYGCAPFSPLVNPASCPAGQTKEVVKTPAGDFEVCRNTPAEDACQAIGPDWHVGLDGTCQQLCPGGGRPYATTQCCPPGATVTPDGRCCPYGSYVDPKTGQCTPPWRCPPDFAPTPIPGVCCPPGSKFNPTTGTCDRDCPPGSVFNPNTRECCPPGSTIDPVTGLCRRVDRCPAPWVPNPFTGECCPPGSVVDPLTGLCRGCPPPWVQNPFTGQCCPPGSIVNPVTGQCIPPGGGCPPGTNPTPVPGLCCPTWAPYNPETRTCRPPPPTCPPGSTALPPSGFCCPNERVGANGRCCPAGMTVNPLTGRCACPQGTVPSPTRDGTMCLPPPPTQCPEGMTRNPVTGQCECPQGMVPGPVGGPACITGLLPPCPEGTIRNRVNGQCVPFTGPPAPPPPPLPTPPTPPVCPTGMRHDPITSQCIRPPIGCPAGSRHNPNTSACIPVTTPIPPPICPTGMRHNPVTSRCVPIVPVCPQGQRHDPQSSRCIPIIPTCPQGQRHNPQTSACVPVTPTCPQGQRHNSATSACSPIVPTCPQGQRHNPKTSACVPVTPTCPQGQRHNSATSACSPIVPTCPQGQRHNPQTSACVPITTAPPTCPQGQRHNPQTSRCAPILTTPPPTLRTLPQQQPQIR